MEIVYLEKVSSTHKFLQEKLANGEIKSEYGVYAGEQTNGIGSRGNEWLGFKGNLFFSFCIEEEKLPKDLPNTSVCIYFAWFFLEILRDRKSKVWLKWPNDFYLENLKVGGIISTKKSNFYIGSIGLNLVQAPEDKGILDIKISPKYLINAFEKKIKKMPSWKQIFSKFRVEFRKSRKFSVHYEKEILSLNEAELCHDGSIEINGKRIYNTR